MLLKSKEFQTKRKSEPSQLVQALLFPAKSMCVFMHAHY